MRILLQSTPEGFDLAAAVRDLRSIDGVDDVHHLHAWSLTSGRNLFSGHIDVRSFARDGERVLHEATELLKWRYQVYFSTLQVEEQCLSAEAGAAAIDVTERPERLSPRR